MSGVTKEARSILGYAEGGDVPKEKDPLEMAAEDLLSAVASKDVSGVAAALRNAFQMCESEPHDEAEQEQ
jgi:hypothetical protein